MRSYLTVYDAEIVERDGYLYVMDSWNTSWDHPEEYRQLWPTGVPAQHFSHLIGQKVMYVQNGVYRTKEGLCIRLEHEGETKASKEHEIVRKIKKPRWARDYVAGRWVK